jgi:hypothetical protein
MVWHGRYSGRHSSRDSTNGGAKEKERKKSIMVRN